jgi:tRNA-2-methylthio-N6-dimethylallyladenosine synthase
MAKARGQEIAKQMPHVNLICSPASEDRILEYVEKIQKDGGRIIDLEDRQRDEEFYQAPFNIDANHAQVVISTGCSNHCTYCIVPSVRGELRLRKPEDIVDEVKRNMDLGITRITLLGQNVNDYCFHPSNVNFIDLLKMAADINEIEEVDFMTSHPKNTSSELFNFMAGSHKIKKQLHLPIQSGSDKILKAMNRGYRREQYLKLAADYRHIVEGILGTDIIIGFPGESERDFLDTVDIVKTVGFNYAYIFMYSPRPGTAAAKFADDVPLAEKKRRHAELLALQKKISKGNITKY